MITISGNQVAATPCASVIIAPEMALREAGYIKTLTTNQEASAKHEFFALAQMALFQYQDEELVAELFNAPLTIGHDQGQEQLAQGLLICRDLSGRVRLFAHPAINVKKLLEATNRFCTRWVRLDI
ncbi:MAG: hypothetical protein LBU39_07405 [Desulfobulbaceae bacterium]|jgi:hypothetical protein|nr:hypothetical protein [Desulfobulbaceae bacterium]